MKTIFGKIFMAAICTPVFALSATVMAQNKVVVIPMFSDPPPAPVQGSWQENIAKIEIENVCSVAKFIVVQGPAVEIQIIQGFSGTGSDDQSGLAAEQSLVIETIPSPSVNPSGDCETDLRAWLAAATRKSLSIISTDVGGTEKVRWNFFEYSVVSEQPGEDGGVRFTLDHMQPDDNRFLIERSPAAFPTNPSLNPASDRRVEISGISTGLYPSVEDEDKANATLVLVYDYTEAGGIRNWVESVIESGTSSIGKRSVSVDAAGGGARQNYYGCFPSRWAQFTGFTQYIQLKERVTLECDLSEPAI